MSSTNKTTNYNLSQFVGTDVPSYLGDYNSDMTKIDKAIGDVANSQGSVEQSVVGLTAEVQGLTTQVSGVSTSVQQIQTSVAQIDTAYKQADTALSQRITANANNIQANTESIESINTVNANILTAIGTADISGIGDGTIKGAISELNKPNQSFVWKPAGTATGSNIISLPNDFNELNIVVKARNDTNFIINVIKESLTSSRKHFFAGVPLGTTWYGIEVDISLTEVLLVISSDNTTDYLASSVIDVFYR